MQHAEHGDVRDGDAPDTLEGALSRTEADAELCLKAVAAVSTSLKRFRASVHEGNLRELDDALARVEQTLGALREQVAQAQQRWDFDGDAYLSTGAYTRELLETAERMKVRIFEQDDRLYSFPLLMRILPGERTVLVDRARERRLRPSLLVQHLRDLQGQPARFRPAAFLESLFSAYRVLVEKHGKGALDRGRVEPLADLYNLFTLLPGQSRDYSRHEFARDVYLLDRSGITDTRNGYTASFPASTGTKSPGGVITAITENGQERSYWGILFTPPETSGGSA